MLTKRRTIATKVEAVEGVFETLVAADATLIVEELTATPSPEFEDRAPVRATLSTLNACRTKGMGDVTFTFELKGEDGTADSIPSWSRVLEASGLLETVDAGVDVTYSPLDDLTTAPSLSIGVQIDGIVRRFRGCRASAFSLNLPTAGRWMATITMTGVLVGNADVDEALFVPTYPTTKPPVWGSGTATVGGINLTAATTTIDMGITGTLREDPNLEFGLRSYTITGRRIAGTIDPELTIDATKPWREELFNNVNNDIDLELGSATGNTLHMDIVQAQWKSMGDEDRDGLALAAMAFDAQGTANGAADEWALIKS